MPTEQPTGPKLFALSEAQVKRALLALMREEYQKGWTVDHYAMTSNGKFIVKLTKTP